MFSLIDIPSIAHPAVVLPISTTQVLKQTAFSVLLPVK